MARTTTDPTNWKFAFTVTDLARFLGKSPVTLRHWERNGLVVFPRDSNGDRRLTTDEVRRTAQIAYKLRRISDARLHMVEAAVYLLENIEAQNNAEDRSHRGTKLGQNGASPTPTTSAT
ncbi:MAG: hypothetical protein JWR61_5789 [Ferruginibacter sp.]|uniref:MerR family transcriptional regulator n=1 Tax=Ferruginibacter sp. TaxID=1940288 RepID=UPI003467E353|nr:hypothetical protein [Ferruginibacter sp.]